MRVVELLLREVWGTDMLLTKNHQSTHCEGIISEQKLLCQKPIFSTVQQNQAIFALLVYPANFLQHYPLTFV